jgi:hypothetical protein
MTGVVTFGLPTMNSLVIRAGRAPPGVPRRCGRSSSTVLPTPGSPVTMTSPPVGSGRGRERADPVHLRLAPDQTGGLSTVALPFVELRDAEACHGRKACPQTCGDRTKQSDPLPHGRQVLPTPESFAALDDRSRGGSRCLLGRTLAIPSYRRRLRNCESADQGSPRPHTPADYEQRTRRRHGAPCGSTAAPSRVEDY